jgi:hypothetical protein
MLAKERKDITKEGERPMEQLPGAIKTLAIFCAILGVIVAIPVLLIGYWYISVPIIALIVVGVIAMKKQKAQANRV